MHEIFGSKEFWSALFGAAAAFLLEALRRRIAERQRQVAAGNEAVFALAQMHAVASLIFTQAFADREAEVRRLMKREPVYFEILPLELPLNASIRLPFDRLGFVLASYHPDLLNTLAGVDREFVATMQTLAERNRLHLELQRRQMLLPQSSSAVSLGVFEGMIGADVCMPLRQSTEVLKQQLQRCAEDTGKVGREFTRMLAYQFPTARVTSFTPIDRTPVLNVPKPTPPAWRRALRRLVMRVRRPTGVNAPDFLTLKD